MIVELDGERVFVGTGSIAWEAGAAGTASPGGAPPASDASAATLGDADGAGDDRSDARRPAAGRPVLLLLHGAGMDRTVWVLLARYFARHGHHVVAPDLPGHGGSGGAPLASVEAQADWVWRLLDALRAEHGLGDGALVCAGHSMGALAAVAMAGQRPSDVAHLLLLGAGYPMAVGAPLLDAAEANARAAVDMITIYGHSHASRLGRNTMAGISVVNQAAALLARAAPGVLHADLAACNGWRGAEAAAERYGGGRTTILAGDADRMTPARGTRTLAALLDARVVTLADCGHMMTGEQPETTLQAMRDALGSALRTRGT